MVKLTTSWKLWKVGILPTMAFAWAMLFLPNYLVSLDATSFSTFSFSSGISTGILPLPPRYKTSSLLCPV